MATAAPQVVRSSLNANLLKAQYAVRGPIVVRAMEHEEALKRGEERPFSKVIYCNIGNPQQLGQKPVTFARQVLGMLAYPDLITGHAALFPTDAVARAQAYLDAIPGGTGAYSESQGIKYIRQEVADFITERDGGAPSYAENIFLTDGASPGVQTLLGSIIRDNKDGVLVPIPQYPLYSATIAKCGGRMVGYNMDETTNWGLDMAVLRDSLAKAKDDGTNVRGLTVINPGNPTGGCLTKENAEEVVSFCVDNNLVLMADEVYQENIWADGKSFVSFKKVAAGMGLVPEDPSGWNGLQLASFHSVSKGYFGECGRRGGYFELVGFPADVKAELYKAASISLCPNIMGQVMVGLMVNPPKAGDASYDSFTAEREELLASLRRRASKLAGGLLRLEGVTVQPPEGALYLFPTIKLPDKAIEAAKAKDMTPDGLYCTELLDATGVVIVPGSGFGQKEGTFHFRTTILPPEDEIDAVVERLAAFHSKFMEDMS